MTTPDSPVPPGIDPEEVEKFDALASRWWDTEGAFKPLHDINPLRLAFVAGTTGLADRVVLDVGCGGGILAEAMAAQGAAVTGIDASAAALATARLHLVESGLTVDYRCATAEEMAATDPEAFDLVTCMELLEHVPDPAAVVSACARLVRPGGEVIFSTINRNPRAYLLAVVAAEYVLGLLPRGTHDYARFIRPSELAAWARGAGLALEALEGITYNPLTRRYRRTDDVGVNYLARLRRPADDPGE